MNDSQSLRHYYRPITSVQCLQWYRVETNFTHDRPSSITASGDSRPRNCFASAGRSGKFPYMLRQWQQIMWTRIFSLVVSSCVIIFWVINFVFGANDDEGTMTVFSKKIWRWLLTLRLLPFTRPMWKPCKSEKDCSQRRSTLIGYSRKQTLCWYTWRRLNYRRTMLWLLLLTP